MQLKLNSDHVLPRLADGAWRQRAAAGSGSALCHVRPIERRGNCIWNAELSRDGRLLDTRGNGESVCAIVRRRKIASQCVLLRWCALYCYICAPMRRPLILLSLTRSAHGKGGIIGVFTAFYRYSHYHILTKLWRPVSYLLYLQVLKVAILAEKYAVDYTWYVDVILNLIRMTGDYVSEEVRAGFLSCNNLTKSSSYCWCVIREIWRWCVCFFPVQVWYRVIQIVTNRDDVQGYAAKTVFEVSLMSSF